MADDLPFKAEYAKTSRSGCKKCKEKIPQGELRLARMVQSAMFDGKVPNWFHEKCFFQKQRPQTEGDISNFGNLKFEDQEKIRSKIGGSGGASEPKKGGKGRGKKRGNAESSSTNGTKNVNDFGIEYAKSGRATCCGCQLKITKDELRIKKTVYDTEVGMKYGGQPLWHHTECFAKLRNELGWFESGEVIPGFKSLSDDDKENVKNLIPAVKNEDIPATKKMKAEPKDEVDIEEEKKLKELVRKQNEEMYYIRNALQNNLKKREIIELLEANGQQIPEGNTEKLDLLADILTFGALKPCKECKGQLKFSSSVYVCTGDLSEWVKCSNSLKEPPRVAFKIPADLKKTHSFLKKLKSKVANRAVIYIPPSTVTSAAVKKEDELDSGPKIQREKPSLYEWKFGIVGLEEQHDEIKKRLSKLGGCVVSTINEKVIAVFSDEKEVENVKGKMISVKKAGIHVVPVAYLDAVEMDGAAALSFIKSKSICDWGTDPSSRLPKQDTKSGKSKSIYTKSVPKSVTLKVKGGLAVDPDSGLQHRSHVLVNNGVKYNAVLNLTDVQKKVNKYYKLQVLEGDCVNKYWLFRSWGRIGTTIGGNKTEQCATKDYAIRTFEDLYTEKTGNSFSLHGTSNFKKMPGLMYPVDIDYEDNENITDINADHKIKSTLPVSVQEIIKLIFDVKTMKKVMLQFDLDLEKMPLGKLSRKQIQSAYSVLTEISGLIGKGGTNVKFIECTNRFYTLIPHSFGVDNPPIIDTDEQIKTLTEKLDSLMEIERAYSMLKVSDVKEDESPIDHYYEQLKTRITPLEKESEEYKLIDKYVQNTHAETHSSYALEIVNVFKVEREGEIRRYKPFKKLHNRKLLWHGSRVTNFAGILSNGLKIAPPEAPSTGYMFGKGIYFADMVSKSANYCYTNYSNPTGLLLLSEVALGDMLECYSSNYITELPRGKHSTIGVGGTKPDPAEAHIREDGVEIPLGKPIKNNDVRSSLLYNEYIIYDVAQANIQYMLQMNFKYRY